MADIHGLLGFAQRSGGLVSGEQGVEHWVRRGRVFLIIIAQDAAENTRRRFQSLAENSGTPVVIWGSKDALGRLIGKPQRAVVAVTDREFAAGIRRELLENGTVGEKN